MTRQHGGEGRPGGRSSVGNESLSKADAPNSDAAVADVSCETRQAMVAKQILARGVHDSRVLQAMRTVPRHRFLPENRQEEAYDDRALPLGPGQSLSQPYVVAMCTQLVIGDEWDDTAPKRVLEVGSGTGYQMAVLAEIVPEVLGIEIDKRLMRRSQTTLTKLSYRNCEVRQGDGWHGLPGAAPFDAILVTACADKAPPALRNQLAIGGRLVMPIGPSDEVQHLRVITRTSSREWHQRDMLAVQFVPMKRPSESESAAS